MTSFVTTAVPAPVAATGADEEAIALVALGSRHLAIPTIAEPQQVRFVPVPTPVSSLVVFG